MSNNTPNLYDTIADVERILDGIDKDRLEMGLLVRLADPVNKLTIVYGTDPWAASALLKIVDTFKAGTLLTEEGGKCSGAAVAVEFIELFLLNDTIPFGPELEKGLADRLPEIVALYAADDRESAIGFCRYTQFFNKSRLVEAAKKAEISILPETIERIRLEAEQAAQKERHEIAAGRQDILKKSAPRLRLKP